MLGVGRRLPGVGGATPPEGGACFDVANHSSILIHWTCSAAWHPGMNHLSLIQVGPIREILDARGRAGVARYLGRETPPPRSGQEALIDQLGLTDQGAALLIHVVEREYGFVEPPDGEPVPVTLRLLATIEFLKETLSDFDEGAGPPAALR